MTTETEPMVRVLASICQKCGESWEGPFSQEVSPAKDIRFITENYVHGVSKEGMAARPDGTSFGWPGVHLKAVHCGGHPLFATEPVR